jgi:hypothetical protein
MGALYAHVSPEIRGITNNVVNGFFRATPEEWQEFFGEGAKYKLPPGERVGREASFWEDFSAHWAKQLRRDFPPENFLGRYYPPQDAVSYAYREVLHTSSVTGEKIAYLAPVIGE